MTGQGDETITARELWERLVTMDAAGQRAYLVERELFIDGEWRTYGEATVFRNRRTPLLLYAPSHPHGERRVPMDTAIPVRRRL